MVNPFDISLKHDGQEYTGWARSSGKSGKDGEPTSFHVVLNDTLFGNVSRQEAGWTVDEQRPDGLTQAVGKAIEKVRASEG